jgi:Ner family transcriptional regulator
MSKKTNIKKRDWPNYKITYELKRVGSSMATIAAELGLHPRSIYSVQRQPWVSVEAAIALKLGCHPSEIWPSRYNKSGRPNYPYRSARRPGTKAVSETLKYRDAA